MKYQNRVMRFDSMPEILQRQEQEELDNQVDRRDLINAIGKMHGGSFTRWQVWVIAGCVLTFFVLSYAFFPDVAMGGGQP